MATRTKQYSIRELQLLSEYTNNSSPYNKFLSTLAGLNKNVLPYFDTITQQKIIIIMSLIYNAEIKDRTILYQNYKPEFRDFRVDNQSQILIVDKPREVSSETINMVFNSTTANKDVLKYLSMFHAEGCCTRSLYLDKFPIFNVSGFSTYMYQDEVILPPFIRVDWKSAPYLSSKAGHKRLRPDVEKYCEKLEYYKADDVTKCTQTQESRVFGGSTYILNKECFRDKKINTSLIRHSDSIVDVIVLHRQIIEFINRMLSKYYACKEMPSLHGFLHICNTITISIILYLDYIEKAQMKDNDKARNHLYILICAVLFHDAGRECRDGTDIWEADSRRIAMLEINELNGPAFLDSVSAILSNGPISGDNAVLRDIYKGADSIDIARAQGYNERLNPLYETYRQYTQKERLTSEDTLVSEFHTIFQITSGILHSTAAASPDRPEDFFDDEEITGEDISDNFNLNADICTAREEFTFPIFNTYNGFNTIYPNELIEYDEDTDLTDFLSVKINEFIDSAKEVYDKFKENRYLQDETRYFDDYWEILLTFLPVFPYSLRHLSRVILPFEYKRI